MASKQRWQVLISRRAERILRRLPRAVLERINVAIDSLVEDPYPAGNIKLSGCELYRIRVGRWRIIYAVEDEDLIVLILTIARRGEAYRNL